jgi:RHS repeat-associated protein
MRLILDIYWFISSAPSGLHAPNRPEGAPVKHPPAVSLPCRRRQHARPHRRPVLRPPRPATERPGIDERGRHRQGSIPLRPLRPRHLHPPRKRRRRDVEPDRRRLRLGHGCCQPIGNPFLYTGRRHEAETGLYYFRSRYMSPQMGRFISSDTIGVWGDPNNLGNAYALCKNAYPTCFDPSGERCIEGTGLGPTEWCGDKEDCWIESSTHYCLYSYGYIQADSRVIEGGGFTLGGAVEAVSWAVPFYNIFKGYQAGKAAAAARELAQLNFARSGALTNMVKNLAANLPPGTRPGIHLVDSVDELAGIKNLLVGQQAIYRQTGSGELYKIGNSFVHYRYAAESTKLPALDIASQGLEEGIKFHVRVPQ